MSTKEIVDFVEKKRRTCSQNLRDWLDEGEISRESYQELTLCNEQLSQILKTSFIKGQWLVQKKVVSSLSELLVSDKKPRSDEEAFEVMRRVVVEGSENSCIRNFALNIAEKSSERRGIPVAIPPVDRLYLGFMEREDIQSINAFVHHCANVARDIYEFVRSNWTYVSDPPDDYYQPACHTLEILNLKGDCDDFAILLCSLLRSIGYRTFLGFQPQHVFAGVVLARPSSSPTGQNESEKKEVALQHVEVPLDTQLEGLEIEFRSQKMLFNGFDVLNGQLLDKSVNLTRQAGRISEDDVRSIQKDLVVIRDRLSKISNSKVFFVDSTMPTIKIVDVFRQNLSQIAE